MSGQIFCQGNVRANFFALTWAKSLSLLYLYFMSGHVRANNDITPYACVRASDIACDDNAISALTVKVQR